MQRAAAMQLLADKCPPVFGETLNRPVGYMQVEPGNSHGPIPQGLRSELETPEALPNVKQYTSDTQLGRTQSHNTVEELPRSSTEPPHNCTMTLRLEVSPDATTSTTCC